MSEVCRSDTSAWSRRSGRSVSMLHPDRSGMKAGLPLPPRLDQSPALRGCAHPIPPGEWALPPRTPAIVAPVRVGPPRGCDAVRPLPLPDAGEARP